MFLRRMNKPLLAVFISALLLPILAAAWDFSGVFLEKQKHDRVIQSSETVKAEPEAFVVADPELVIVAEPQPVVVAEPEPLVAPDRVNESKPMVMTEPEPVIAAAPDPVAVVGSEPVVVPVIAPADEASPINSAREVRTPYQSLYLREVLFDFFQQQYFSGLTKLGVSDSFDRLPIKTLETDVLKGDMLLSWGQHSDATELFESLLDRVSDRAIRNQTHFYLAKTQYQRGYFPEAAKQFEAIEGAMSEQFESERLNLHAQVYLALGQYDDAITLLTNSQSDEAWTRYAQYNLGVALITSGNDDQGAGLLDAIGKMKVTDEELLALRDRANLALGYLHLQAGSEVDARSVLRRIRMKGLSSSKALLGYGWTDAAADDYQRALVPWMELSDRDVLDGAVQESLLAVPYAFNQLGAIPQAAEYYARALDVYNAEIARLDIAIEDAEQGHSIVQLLSQANAQEGGWYWQLDQLSDDDRTRYLYFVIADHRFHQGLKGYRELKDLQQHFSEWSAELNSLRDRVQHQDTKHIDALTTKLSEMQNQIAEGIAQHEQYLNEILRIELEQQRERIVSYRAQARFSLATVYDRMSAENR